MCLATWYGYIASNERSKGPPKKPFRAKWASKVVGVSGATTGRWICEGDVRVTWTKDTWTKISWTLFALNTTVHPLLLLLFHWQGKSMVFFILSFSIFSTPNHPQYHQQKLFLSFCLTFSFLRIRKVMWIKYLEHNLN